MRPQYKATAADRTEYDQHLNDCSAISDGENHQPDWGQRLHSDSQSATGADSSAGQTSFPQWHSLRQALLRLLRPSSRPSAAKSRQTQLATTAGGASRRGDDNEQLWIAMDYIDGTDAAQLIQQRYPAGMPAEPLSLSSLPLPAHWTTPIKRACCTETSSPQHHRVRPRQR
jgi:hypothetical protein